MVVILGDNIFQMIFFRMLKSLQTKRRCESAIAICRRSERFGVAHIQNRKIVEIEEKPKRAEKFLCGYGNLFV